MESSTAIKQDRVVVRKANARDKLEPVEINIDGLTIPADLPLWSSSVRGVPNSILRSALFGATKRGPRQYQMRVKKASVDGVVIIHTGPTLDQADLDVWEQCLHLSRDSGLGCRIEFSANSFLKAIKRTSGGKDIEWLKNAFARLSSSTVEIQDGKKAYFGPMLHHGARDDITGRYVIEINPAIVSLYGKDGWSSVEWDQRLLLKGKGLAQWLHGFYSTHAAPYDYKIETILRLSGAENDSIVSFKQELGSALKDLTKITGWKWSISSGLLHISKLKTIKN